MSKVYLFYENVPELNAFDELKLLTQARRAWTGMGFEPVVLNLWHAKQHHLYTCFSDKVKTLPTVNPPIYELLCFVRWLALAQVGGGFMADNDLIPYNGAKDVMCKYLEDRLRAQLVMFQERAPSLVHADKVVAEWFCSKVISDSNLGNRPQEGKGHVSDQYFLEDLASQSDGGLFMDRRDDVKGYGDVGWEAAPFVHYSNASMSRHNKQPKWRHIPTLRK